MVIETAGFTTRLNALVAVLLFASLIVKVTEVVPLAVGVPEITPPVDKLNPLGNVVEVQV